MAVRSIIVIAVSLYFLAGCASTSTPRGTTPEALLLEGDEYSGQKKYEDAILRWKKAKEMVTAPDIVALADLKIADALFADEKYIEAAAEYENFRKLHPSHESIPYVVYRLGYCYFNEIAGIDTEQTPVKNAVAMFETFLRQYPSSADADKVREKLAVSRDKQLQYEIYVGRFYFRTGKYPSAIKRLEEALVSFPKSDFHDETLFYLGQAYLAQGEKKKGGETLTRLLHDYPSSKLAGKAKKLLRKG